MSSAAALFLILGISIALAFIGYALRVLREERAASAAAATGTAVEPAPATLVAAQESVAGDSDSEADGGESTGIDSDSASAPALHLIASLLRDVEGRLVVEVEGRTFRNLEQIDDARLRARLRAARDDLAALVDAPVAQPRETSVAAQPAVLDDAQPPPPTPVKKLSVAEAAALPLQKPSMSVLSQLRYLRRRQVEPQIELKTMIDEIDELLQARIADTPLASRGLRIGADEQGEVQFQLDGVAYSTADDLPANDIRQIVKACIEEWEGR